MLQSRLLANRCCTCCNEESVDHLLIFCSLAHSLWVHMLQLFGIHWVMPGSVANLLFVGNNGLGNIIPIFGIWFQAI